MSTAQTKTSFETGRQHFREGVPRANNPFYVAAFVNGARKPEKRQPAQQWWAGWDHESAAQAKVVVVPMKGPLTDDEAQQVVNNMVSEVVREHQQKKPADEPSSS